MVERFTNKFSGLKRITNYSSWFGLIALISIYYIQMGESITAYSMGIIIEQAVIVAIVATGAIFIFSFGQFDISLGAATAVAAMVSVITYNRTESIFLMLLASILVGVSIGVIESILAVLLNLPVFVLTVAMLSILSSLVRVLLGGQSSISIPSDAVAAFDNVPFKLFILICYFLLCFFIFNYTKVGRESKFLGANPIAAKQSGVSNKKITIIAFILVGIGVGLAGFLTVIRAPMLGQTTAASLGLDVLVAIVFGGMPLSGGARSKISAAVVGAFSIVLLNQVLLSFGFSSGQNQIAKAILFLFVVFVATINYRKKILPR
ncbi:ribose transport system permease protein [Natronobacillus azotifigens]|uniref:ABC transporter permease n=1 Tax=Natronobacillus azotifigens TaxID=472978 RepID=A0A9J6R8H7_9BACI|nr:ABC transporter permease [Natronobacillus azotifigens]MCZ0701611.1 ABC transporter permease [Natronobacillus azotifigens]